MFTSRKKCQIHKMYHSDAVSINMSYLSTPLVPSIVEALTGNGFPTSIELSWTRPTERNGIITGYFLTYSTGSGELSSENIPASVTSYTVTGLEENTLYQLTVSAETGAGRGEGSTVSVRTLPDGGSCSMQLNVCGYVCG